jgi:two-component system, LytTR family, sensor histidine kinase AlgZ
MNFPFTRPAFTLWRFARQPLRLAPPPQGNDGPIDSTRAERAQWWQPVALSLVMWAAITLLLVIALVTDNIRGRGQAAFAVPLLNTSIVMLPLAVVGVVLAGFFARGGARYLVPRPIALIYCLLLGVFLPVFVYYEQVIELVRAGKPLPGVWQALSKVPEQYWYLDGLVLSLVFVAQLGYAIWRQERARYLAVQASRKANVALRLSLLQGQLEPGFLLTTLDGIATLVQEAERSLALRALARLSDLLRYALRVSQQTEGTSMADELEFMRHYLALQTLRPDLQLDVHWDVDGPEWSAWTCPPLLLVPLLDLAIKQHPQHRMMLLRLKLELNEQTVCWRMQWQQPEGSPHVVPEPGALQAMAADSDLCSKPQYQALDNRLRLQFPNAATLACHQDASQCRIELTFPASHI